uniref:Fucolectin-related protein n=1 Tax=Littorina littorea TaxID=31216 RepID=A0A0A7RRJ4_LITLI|nr:fucolectin-related protein [Littorina littorea]
MACYRRRLRRLFCLQLCLISAQGQALSNVALNKPATQSTNHGDSEKAQLAVDGNKATHINYCTHTADKGLDPNSYRWWRVDLEGLFEVHAVVITNRGDCCGFRLANFDILVSSHLTDPSQYWPDTSALCLHRGPQIADGATERLDCSQPTAGRYVTLLISQASEPLHFCELEVLGVPARLGELPSCLQTHSFSLNELRSPPQTWP